MIQLHFEAKDPEIKLVYNLIYKLSEGWDLSINKNSCFSNKELRKDNLPLTLTDKLFANEFEWHLLCCIAPASYVMVVEGNSNILVGVVCTSVVLDTGH